ncbi:hypothetical protein ONZ43_g5530 [Nemania bipapillata]|uniref:Uncharacterized protein n=1 Tax=Nemania bipapillata TaxID=110536 RepID=A0ACC2I9L8_9PEZI|nr:hypothetical protein ONZ43_g5530 [Nemania bipapillata]
MGPYNLNGLRIRLGEFSALKATKNTNFTPPGRFDMDAAEALYASFDPPQGEVVYASFRWCERSYQGITVDPSGVGYVIQSSNQLRCLYNASSDLGCNCEDCGYLSPLIANSTNSNYSIDEVAHLSLTHYLNVILSTKRDDYQPFVNAVDDEIIDKGAVLYQQDLGNLTTNLADTLTNILRSRELDENFNITDVPGRAFYSETYIRVEWGWLLHPLGQAFYVTLLFICCIIATSKQPLLKDSVLAYLATTIEDNTGSTSGFSIAQRTSREHLEELAEDIIVKLEPDEKGHMKFSKKYA